MADEGMTMTAIRRIIELEQQLAEVIRHRDDLAARLSEVSSERLRLAHQLNVLLLRQAGREHSQADSEPSADGERQTRHRPRGRSRARGKLGQA